MQNCSGRKRLMTFAACTYEKASRTLPVTCVPTFWADEALGPSQLKKILITSLFVRKALVKLQLIFGKIFGNAKIRHNWPPFLKFETSIAGSFDKYGQNERLLSLEYCG